MFEARTLHHQSSNSTVRPSRRSCRPASNAAAMASIRPVGSSTFELISPESAYRRNGASSDDSGTSAFDSSPRATTAAMSPESAR